MPAAYGPRWDPNAVSRSKPPPPRGTADTIRAVKWTQSNTFRGFVVAVLVVFVVLQVVQRDWPWLLAGSALLLLNVVSWRAQVSRAGRAPVLPRGDLAPDAADVTLSELLDRPAVRQAWDTSPAVWRQVSYLEDDDDLSLEASEVADYVWLLTSDETQWHWSVAVGDELKPLLDLDVDPDEDPLIATLAGHPAVAEVDHVDREEYAVVLRSAMTLDEIAVLAVHGLVAHHLDAVRRLKRT